MQQRADYRVISGALLKKAGFTRNNGMTGAVTLIQRFGRSGAPGALNLNPNAARSTFTCCLLTVSTGRCLPEMPGFPGKRRGKQLPATQDGMEEDLMQQLLGHSITHRIAVDPMGKATEAGIQY